MTQTAKHSPKIRLSIMAFMLSLMIAGTQLWCQQNDGSTSSSGSVAIADTAASKPISILAVVRDKHGDIVANLTKDDFTLEEDGHPQIIQSVTPQSDLP